VRTALLVFATSLATLPFASSQSARDFVISSPRPVIQLVEVEQLPSANFHLTFKNISSQTILEICISAEHGLNEMVCMTGFADGAKLPEPGGTFSMTFDASGFASDSQSGQSTQNSLRVDAVVYTDGTHFGDNAILARLADRMFGDALESKRISDLLSNSTDGGASGLDNVLPQIGTTPLSSTAEAAEGLKDESMPGVSPLVINSYLSSHSQGFLEGVTLATDNALHDINQQRDIAAAPVIGEKYKSQIILRARSHGLSDLAEAYRSLSNSQISYLISFLGAQDEK
jgi:hypothetical protein